MSQTGMRGNQSWFKIVVFSTCITLLFFGMAEVTCRFLFPLSEENDYFSSRGFSDKFLHWKEYPQADGTVRYETTPSLLKVIPNPGYRQSFVMPKKKGVYRVFVFGGSSAAGGIYTVKGSISDQIQLRLADLLPERRVEVINAAIEGYGSIRVLALLRQAATFDPDLLIVYSGHNDIGERAFYRKLYNRDFNVNQNRLFQKSSFYNLLRSLILSQILQKGREKSEEDDLTKKFSHEQKEAQNQLQERKRSFQEEYTASIEQFRKNMSTIIKIANSREIPLILMTVVPNYGEWEPEFNIHPVSDNGIPNPEIKRLFEASHVALEERLCMEADSLLNKILDLDSRFAEAMFRKAFLLEMMLEPDGARDLYCRATRYDTSLVMPRTTDEFNDVLRTLARQKEFIFIDIEQFIIDATRDIIGTEWIFDGCHPNEEGYELISRLIVQVLAQNHLPQENSLARLSNLRSNSEYRSLLGFSNQIVAAKHIKMAYNTLKLTFPRNTLAPFRNFQIALKLDPYSPPATAGMALLFSYLKDGNLSWDVSSCFPDREKYCPSNESHTVENRKASFSDTAASEIKTRSAEEGIVLSDYEQAIIRLGLNDKNVLAQLRQANLWNPVTDTRDKLFRKWQSLKQVFAFRYYWTWILREYLENELSFESTVEQAFIFQAGRELSLTKVPEALVLTSDRPISLFIPSLERGTITVHFSVSLRDDHLREMAETINDSIFVDGELQEQTIFHSPLNTQEFRSPGVISTEPFSIQAGVNELILRLTIAGNIKEQLSVDINSIRFETHRE